MWFILLVLKIVKKWKSNCLVLEVRFCLFINRIYKLNFDFYKFRLICYVFFVLVEKKGDFSLKLFMIRLFKY